MTYSYNFKEQKYIDYVCILSVLAQVAIDNAKRRFDVDLNKEIKRIKDDMMLKENGYPEFWGVVKKDFNKKLINPELKCPMNYLCSIKFKQFKPNTSTLPVEYFFIKFDMDKKDVGRRSKRVEELIKNYSLNLYNYNSNEVSDEYLLLRNDFEELVDDINKIYISQNYIGLMSWLLDRAFCITPQMQSNKNNIKTTINTNKSVLLKTLYSINPALLLKCFSKNIEK